LYHRYAERFARYAGKILLYFVCDLVILKIVKINFVKFIKDMSNCTFVLQILHIIIKKDIYVGTRKERFDTEVSKNLTRYRFENNLVRSK